MLGISIGGVKDGNISNMNVEGIKKLFGMQSNIYDKLFAYFVEYSEQMKIRNITEQNKKSPAGSLAEIGGTF